MITTDHALRTEAAAYAENIFDEFKDANGGAAFDAEAFRDEMQERVHEAADNSEHVIYTARAIAICGNCNTDAGEAWLEEVYEAPFNGCETFADVCTRLAFAVLYTSIGDELNDLIEEWEPAEEAEAV